MTIQQAHSNDLRPLSDRLPPLVKRSKGVAPPPSADSMTQLLVQSISSDDSKLLEEVLRVSKEKIVSATVKKLPVHIVLPLMRKVYIATPIQFIYDNDHIHTANRPAASKSFQRTGAKSMDKDSTLSTCSISHDSKKLFIEF